MKLGTLEFKNNLDIDGKPLKNRNPEIVCNAVGSLFTVCWFIKDSDGYCMQTVGNRPWQNIKEDWYTAEEFYLITEYAMTVLDAQFRLQEKRSELKID